MDTARHGSSGEEALARVQRPAPDFVEFALAGMLVDGDFHCSECGYGVSVHRELPRCPMCGSGSWEANAWSPSAGELFR